MRTRTSSTPPRLTSRQLNRIWPLATIVLLHAGFFYALQNGLLRHSAPAVRTAVPREVFATFLTPEPAPQPPKPQPAPPKPAPVPKKPAVKPITRPTPPAEKAPAPKAITPPPAPAPVEPAAPAVAAPAPAAPPVPAAPVASAQPKVFSSGIEYIQPPQPDYPPLARRMGEEGRAVLRVLVNEKGRPEQVEVQRSSGFARLDEAARQAAMRALFKPFIDNGRAVAAYAIVPIRFQLNN